MSKLTTNRDLYLAIIDLTHSAACSQPTLEFYLSMLLQRAMTLCNRDSITLDEFFDLLRDSFSGQSIGNADILPNDYAVFTDQLGFEGWQITISSQVIDLQEMAESGALSDKMRYFGLKSPRGAYWVNFDPSTFLECATEGTFGGWEPGDKSDRCYVPGPVAVLSENDQIVTMNPQDVPRPIYEMPRISWDLFRDFLRTGQFYE